MFVLTGIVRQGGQEVEQADELSHEYLDGRVNTLDKPILKHGQHVLLLPQQKAGEFQLQMR